VDELEDKEGGAGGQGEGGGEEDGDGEGEALGTRLGAKRKVCTYSVAKETYSRSKTDLL